MGESPSRLDIAAFYDGREHNWNTISLAAQLDHIELILDKDRGLQEARKIFSDTAAPCVLFAGNGKADLWLRCWEQPTPVKNIDFNPQQLRRAFEQNRREMERDALAALRGGQRYLFDGFHLARREELATFLNRGITKATWLYKKTKKEDLGTEAGKALSRVAIGLLAARILEDKGILGTFGDQSSDARQLLSDANSLADGFFKDVITHDLTKLDAKNGSDFVDEMLLRIMAHLTGPASFSMVTPEMLGDLYENALRAERKRGGDLELDGIHYTPLALTRNVLSRIPLEELPPSKRRVLDIACGSGTFLLAATERLRSTFDANEADAEATVLDHLRSHVVGYDQDDVALHVANLTYLLDHVIWTRDATTVPLPILRRGDALTLSAGDFLNCDPSIIVGNPPFGNASDGDLLANKFLSKALELLAPGGFLGMVMPGAFLKMMERGGIENTRRSLLQSCELLEIWEMPEGTIGLTARHETCLVIARKRNEESKISNPVLFRVTYSRSQEAIRAQRDHVRSTWTFMANGIPGSHGQSWTADYRCRIVASPIDHVWKKLYTNSTVESFCDQTEGIKISPRNTAFSSVHKIGYYPYLQTQKRISPYFVHESDWRNDPGIDREYVNPDTATEPRKYSRPLLHGPKLIVTSNTNRNARSQLRVAFDDTGVFPGHNFKCLGLFEDRSKMSEWAAQLVAQAGERPVLLWIAAVMNSAVAHAWVATYSPPRSTAIRVFMTLPIPAEYDPVIAAMVEATKAVGRNSEEHAALTAKINEAVLNSYGLSTVEFSDLRKYLDSLTDPWAESPPDAHVPRRGKYRRISGVVASIDVLNQAISLDLPRYSRETGGPILLPLPKEMPGWALHEGAEFTCAVPVESRSAEELQLDPWLLRDFLPVPYSYLDVSGLEEILGFEKLGPAH